MTTGKKFAVFDIDGTLVRWQLYHAIADSLAKLGHIDPEASKAILTARSKWKKRAHSESFKDYERELVRIYDNSLKQLAVKDFQAAAEVVFEEYKDQVYTYTRDLIKRLKAENYLLLAISGSQSEIVEKIANYYGFDDFVGTEYIHKNGHFSGESIFYARDKKAVLEGLIKKHGLSLNDSIAVGDTAGDISMLEAVEQPIAFNPERMLFEHAKSHDWKVVVERKNMIYKLESTDGKYQLA